MQNGTSCLLNFALKTLWKFAFFHVRQFTTAEVKTDALRMDVAKVAYSTGGIVMIKGNNILWNRVGMAK